MPKKNERERLGSVNLRADEETKQYMGTIKKMEKEGHKLCHPLLEAEEEWSAHVKEVHEQTLMNVGDKVNSWMMGANIENRKSRVLIYFGGAGVYYDRLRESVDNDFPELTFS